MREMLNSEIAMVAGGSNDRRHRPGGDDPDRFNRGGSYDTGASGTPPSTPIVPDDLLFNDTMYDKPPPDPDGPRELLD